MPASDHDWTKPAAMAIPKEGYLRAGTGQIRPRLSTNPRLLRLHDHREDQARPGRSDPRVREDDRGDHRRPARRASTPCKLHYLRWVLFDIGTDTYFMYQGIFDTDFDKYTEDAVALFSKYGINTVFENLEGFPEDWKTNPAAFVKFVREHQLPELPGIRGVPVRDAPTRSRRRCG